MHRRHPPRLMTLNQATPKVTEQYKRLVEIEQTCDQGDIVPTETHIDFRLDESR
jgi:hypothetical protein